MGLREGDLKDTVLRRISIDEFEPKTGESKDVVVVGFRTMDRNVAEDLNAFLSNSTFYKSIRDTEISPNRDDDGYFMLFLEVERQPSTYGFIKEMIKDISRVAGNMKWEASTHLTDDYLPLDEAEQYFISNSEEYMTREEWDEQNSEKQAVENRNNEIVEFLKNSDISNVEISENTIKISKGDVHANLQIVGLGTADKLLKDLNLHESAVDTEFDAEMQTFNRMLGEMSAIRIDKHIVIYGRNTNTVLVTK